MTTQDNDDELKSLWQQPQEVNVQALIDQVANERKKTLRLLVFDIVSNLIALGVLFYFHLQGVFGNNPWFFPGVVILTIAYLWWAITWRRGLWEAAGRSAVDLLKRKRKHAELDIKIGRSFSWGVSLAAVTGALFARFTDFDPQLELSPTIRLTVLTILACLFGSMFIWGVLKERKAKREIVRIDALLQELLDQTGEQ